MMRRVGSVLKWCGLVLLIVFCTPGAGAIAANVMVLQSQFLSYLALSTALVPFTTALIGYQVGQLIWRPRVSAPART